jgi:hypothetical protein
MNALIGHVSYQDSLLPGKHQRSAVMKNVCVAQKKNTKIAAMGKDKRINIRINSKTLDAFDYIVGERNRSKEIIKLIENKIVNSGKLFKYGKDNV